jgi:SAM-dependent methyltransferase
MISCLACNFQGVLDKGVLPVFHKKLFGGEPLSLSMESGHLFWCPQCNLYFRHPHLPQEITTRLYQNLPASVWEYKGGRPIWKQIQILLEKHSPNKNILDVGCARGDFLASLAPHWKKVGIEPCLLSRGVAQKCNIDLVAHDIYEIPETVNGMGAIVFIDVLEHLTQPFRALEKIRNALAKGGCIIVYTGATDTLAWKLFGRHYWYSSLPEHICFFNLRWFRWAAQKLNLQIKWHKTVSSAPTPLLTSLGQCNKLTLYTLISIIQRVRGAKKILQHLPITNRVVRWQCVPWWTAARDHLLIVLSS